ncbi:MAG TPA: nicotinate-nucleotide--dimethylbenzimidazole phosphoribosyltransferase [Rubrivivax sp.]
MSSPVNRSLISPTSNPLLERALIGKLHKRSETAGSLGELEPLSVRLGLIQNTLKPRFIEPRLMLFAADHGLAVEGIVPPHQRQTHELVDLLLAGRLPISVFARLQQLELTVIDAGMAENLPAHDGLLVRKIAHGTRNARVGAAMSIEQAHAAVRAGMEIGDTLGGNLLACAGIGVGANESAALILSRLTETSVRELLVSGPQMGDDALAKLMHITQSALARHRDISDPIEVLAAFGGFEIAMMVGVMLVAASKRQLIMVDGMPAYAALMLASRIAVPVTDYCVFCRSHSHLGLSRALGHFHASALLELGMDATDGTGATLAWPLLRSAAAMLTDVVEGEDPGPSRPLPILNDDIAG